MDINEAIILHQAGELQKAECGYKEILQSNPNYFHAWHYLGLLYFQQGRTDLAIENIQRAIKIKPDDSHAYYNLGNVYKEAGQLDEAITAYQKAIQINPSNADAYVNLGSIYKMQGLIDLAINYFQNALNLKPNHLPANYNLAYLFQEERRFDEAIKFYQRTLRLQPDLFAAYYNLGYIYHQRKQLEEAIDSYQKALELKPDMSDAYRNLGLAFYDKKEFEESIIYYQKALELNPGYIDAYNNLGAIAHDRGNYFEAILKFKKALELDPNLATACNNLGNAFYRIGNDDEALLYYLRALSINAEYAEAHANMSHVLLSQGNFEEGWREYEWRLLKEESRASLFPQPVWDGSSLENKTLLIYAEQGVGDEIMFASCIPDLISLNGSLIVECDKRLVPLFVRAFPKCKIMERFDYGKKESLSPPSADLKLAIGSLPGFFRRDFKAFFNQKPYLMPDERKVSEWKKRFSEFEEKMKIGISWRGGSTPNVIRERSASLEQWAGLFSIPGIAFINLQYGECAEEIRQIEDTFGMKIHMWQDTDPLKDLDVFAAQIAALDLVISVDNATVHMAGALGVPVWVLLPKVCEWRWMKEREDTPWYPTMRLYRQTIHGDWGDVFRVVIENLRHY